MKKIVRIFAVIVAALAFLSAPIVSLAAGSWTKGPTRHAVLLRGVDSSYGLVYEFTADAAAATVPDYGVGDISCFINAIDVEFDSVTPATSGLTVAITTAHGVPVVPATAATTAAPRIEFDKPVQIADGFIIKISGNSVNSGKAKVVIYVM